jgi:hypothetical protein
MTSIRRHHTARTLSRIWQQDRTMQIISQGLVGIAWLLVATSAWGQTPTSKNAGASPRLLTPQNAVLVLIDYQPQMAFADQSMDTQTLVTLRSH